MERQRKLFGVIAILSILLFLGVIAAPAVADQSGLRIPEEVTGDLAYEHVYYLTEDIGVRVTGTVQELETQDYIYDEFERMG